MENQNEENLRKKIEEILRECMSDSYDPDSLGLDDYEVPKHVDAMVALLHSREEEIREDVIEDVGKVMDRLVTPASDCMNIRVVPYHWMNDELEELKQKV